MTDQPANSFTHATQINRLVFFFCYVGLYGSIAGIISQTWNDLFLSSIYSQDFSVQESNSLAKIINDSQLFLVGIIKRFRFLFYFFFFLWLNHAAWNAKALRDNDPAINPGWCVGWFFVPIANFWMPYQKLKQLMDFDAPYRTRISVKEDKIFLRWFWGIFLFYFMVGHRIGKKLTETSPVEAFMEASSVEIFANIISIIFFTAMLCLIKSLIQLQQQAFDDREKFLLENKPTTVDGSL
jgi:hypothetical protein